MNARELVKLMDRMRDTEYAWTTIRLKYMDLCLNITYYKCSGDYQVHQYVAAYPKTFGHVFVHFQTYEARDRNTMQLTPRWGRVSDSVTVSVDHYEVESWEHSQRVYEKGSTTVEQKQEAGHGRG